MRKLNWVARGLLVCLFMGVAVLVQAQDQPNIQLITPGTITRGDEITITGTNLSKNGVRTVVEIDGREAERVEVAKDSVQIKAVVESAPLPEKQQRAGEYTRAVVVKVGEQVSNTYTLRHVTWRAVLAQRVWVAIVLYLALVVAITLGVKASVFRSATGQLSLSKFQMGIWTFVFGLAYVILAAIWKEFLDITDGMFWLMGISATTAVGAKAIVLKNIGSLDPNHPSTLLSDYDKNSNSNKLSLHRCQIAVWTLVVLVIYVVELFDTMRLPDIPDKLLVLMGISGGTYLGFNYPNPKP